MKNKNVFLVRNVAKDGFGGGEIYQLRLARRLKEEGFHPFVITNSKKLRYAVEESGVRTLTPPYLVQQNWSGWRNILLFKYFLFQLRLKKWYSKVFKEYQPGVVNIQSRDDMIAGTLAAKKLGIKVLWTDHADFKNWVLWNVNSRFKNIIGRKIVSLSSQVDKVIFVGREIEKETIEMIYPKRLKNVTVIENGVVDEKEKYKTVRKNEKSFVFLGRVEEEKGVEELVKAFKKVVKKYPDAKLNIYGDGEIEKYKKMCDECDVAFHGRTDDPLKALAENEIFVLPSYREGLSLSLLDAAMMGKRIIASDVGGNPEVVVNGGTGLLVPARSVEKLAEAMIWMMEHKKEANEMAKKARRRYEENFNFEKIFEEKMLPLYNNKKEMK